MSASSVAETTNDPESSARVTDADDGQTQLDTATNATLTEGTNTEREGEQVPETESNLPRSNSGTTRGSLGAGLLAIQALTAAAGCVASGTILYREYQNHTSTSAVAPESELSNALFSPKRNYHSPFEGSSLAGTDQPSHLSETFGVASYVPQSGITQPAIESLYVPVTDLGERREQVIEGP
ncbi:hypothetical protein IAT40_005022 [Kwoniella sp. CBS 6097]